MKKSREPLNSPAQEQIASGLLNFSKKSNVEIHSSLLPLFYMRVLTYCVFSATLLSAIYAEFVAYSQGLSAIVYLLIPLLSHWATVRLDLQSNVFITISMLLIDGFLVGAGFAILHFALVPSLALAVMASATAMTIIGLSGWVGSLGAMFVGSLLTAIVLEQKTMDQAPLLVSAIASLGLCIYVTLTSYYANKQTLLFMSFQAQLVEAQTKAAIFTKKITKYLPSQVWNSIFTGEKQATLGTNRKKLTVFFSDIKGFSHISEQLQPEELTAVLNSYFTEMSNIASEFGGTIDKFMGDGIMIFFGDPKTNGEVKDAMACMAMALKMKKRMQIISHKWESQGIGKKLQIRMGINTGYCTVGNFGAEDRMDYTIIGKEVNLASRLEELAEPGQIFISNSTHKLVQDKVMCRERGKINVRGFTKPVDVLEVMGLRKDMGEKKGYLEHEQDGFAMYLDLEAIPQEQKHEISRALQQALSVIKP